MTKRIALIPILMVLVVACGPSGSTVAPNAAPTSAPIEAPTSAPIEEPTLITPPPPY